MSGWFTAVGGVAALIAALIASLDASAYSAVVKARARSDCSAFVGGVFLDTPDIVYPEEIFTNELPNVPLHVVRDTSSSFGPVNGAYTAVLGRYETTVVPGGIHLASRSTGSGEAQPMANASLVFFTEGTIEAGFSDEFTITLAGMPYGTPFLMTTTFELHGSVGTPYLDPAAPNKVPGAAADAWANGYWGFSLGVPLGPPAGIPSTITNAYQNGSGGLVSVRQNGVQFNQFVQYDMLSPQTLTLYGRSGVPSTLDMYLNIQSGAQGAAGGSPEDPVDGGRADAGVHLAFSNTLGWGGITDVQLLDGTPVAPEDVAQESGSGFDYRQAYVPEPGSLWQAGAAVLVLTRMRRHR